MVEPSTQSNVVCPACPCLCDDLDSSASYALACSRALAHLEARKTVPPPDAVQIEHAARLLCSAQSLAIVGMTACSVETVRAAVALARVCQGWLIPWPADPTLTWGYVAPDLARTWGRVATHADLVVLLDVDPDAMMPRFRERFLSRPDGRTRRIVRIVDDSLVRNTDVNDDMVVWPRKERFRRASEVRAALRGAGEFSEVAGLVNALRDARCVQVFVGPAAAADPISVEPWHWLAAEQRNERNMAIGYLGTTVNGRGATEVLTWLTGYPGPVEWHEKVSRFHPHPHLELAAMLEAGAFDVVVWLGQDRTELNLPEPRNAAQLVIAPRAGLATIHLPVPELSADTDAHVIRGDGVMLRLSGSNPNAGPDPAAEMLKRLVSLVRLAGP